MITQLSLRRRLLAGLAGLLVSTAAQAQVPAETSIHPAKVRPNVTTVYLVRHAEKEAASNPADPTLSHEGEVRARELRQLLMRRHPAAPHRVVGRHAAGRRNWRR